MWPETFSQYDEEQAITGYCDALPIGHKGAGGSGRFLDVGAWDPKTFSNTRALFERGWSGVMIEPSPTAMLSLLKEYGKEPRITLVQGAVGLEDSIVAFEMSDDCVSSSDPKHIARLSEPGPNQAKFHGTAMVRSITWEQICLWYGGFDFVNIDAEGYSVDLFHAMLNAGAKPSCCCVEIEAGRMLELSAAATKVGYKLIYANGTNAVFAL